MDVTYGLLSTLVKTKSIERILAPIASQISLLIILNESEDAGSLQHEDMVPCAQAVMDAASRLSLVARQQAQSSTDQEFIAQTQSSCEVLELSSSNLYVAAERLQGLGPSKEAKHKLVQASKDVLQGTMKVLLVADDAEIRRLITTTHIVTEKLSLLSGSRTMPDLVTRFKEFTDALSIMTSLANKRQRDLTQSCQRERIITALSVLKKCLSSLSVVMQNYVKYSSNPQAEIGKTYVVNEILSAVRDVVDAVQNHDTDEELIETEESGYFVSRIDQVLEALNDDHRDKLHMDLEMWTEGIVRHSMTVAHLCYDNHRDVIIKTCQRLILVKGRVLQLYESQKSNPDLPTIREDYCDVCETLIDEFCELEKNVNISLLHLVVELFKETTDPLERLVKAAVYPIQDDSIFDQSNSLVTEFEDHAEKMCQIANLAAASSTDAKRVHVIRSSVYRLEKLDPEIVPACINIAKNQGDKMCVKHLKLLMKEWTFELTNLLQVLDEMTDPKMFMLVSERKVEEDINTCNGCILISDPLGFSQVVQSLVGRSRRVAQVAERIVDSHDDPVFRNGLMVYIKQLPKAITAVRGAGSNLEADFTNKSHQDTLKKRFNLLQDTLAQVKSGLSDLNHPHMLSPLRRNVRRRDKSTGSKTHSPVRSQQTFDRISRPDGHHGNRFIVTSAPILPSGTGNLTVPGLSPALPADLAIEEQIIQSQQATSQKTEMTKSMSMSQAIPDGPLTYARKLAKDIVIWGTKGDKHRVNLLCGDLLGWTNHIADVTQHVTPHCIQDSKKRELESVCYEVDELAPELIDKVKYVLHGDFSQLQDLKRQSGEWAHKVEQLRIFVDIAVDNWKTLCDKVIEATRKKQTDLVRHQLVAIQGHQEALCSLVTVTESLRWETLVKGQEKIVALWEEKDALENLTVTFKTTSEMVSEQGLAEELLQLEQLGREWSVKVYNMISTLESLSQELLALGLERKIWPPTEPADLPQTLQDENTRLKELLRSACYGIEDKKQLYKGFLADMSDCVAEIKSVTLRKKPGDTMATVARVGSQYNKLRVDLLRGKWILKAVQCGDLIRQQTSQYGGKIDELVENAFTVKSLPDGDDHNQQLSQFQSSMNKFSDNVGAMRKKVLVGIQLSAELSNRSVVRQCLDSITQQTPNVVQVITSFTDPGSPVDLEKLSKEKSSWCCRIRHLVTALEQMTDVKQTLVPEILKLLEVKAQEIQNSEHMLSPTHSSSLLNTPIETFHTTRKSSPRLQSSPGQKTSVKEHKSADTGEIQAKDISFEPAVVDLDQLEKQIQQDLSVKMDTVIANAEEPMPATEPTESQVPSPSKTRIQALLTDSQFIEAETEKWEDINNPIVKVAKTMATQLKHMTNFIRYEGPITSHMGQVETAKALAENSEKILKFAKILCEHCIEESFTRDLRSYCSQLPTVIKQLTVISNVQLGSANFDSSDAMLVKSGQNLMRIILKMMSEAEAVCVKGLRPPSSKDTDQESAFLLAMRWKQKFDSHREQEIQEADQDELGLRVIEDVRPPTLSHIFKA